MTDYLTKLRRILDGLEVASLAVIAEHHSVEQPAATENDLARLHNNDDDRIAVASAIGDLNLLVGAERARAVVAGDDETAERCAELLRDMQRMLERQNDAFGIG